MTTLARTTFRTSRLLDFCSRKELIAQTGHQPQVWPLVVLKELIDNALDACEDARIEPKVEVRVDQVGIAVADNGPGIPPATVDGVLDFSVRVSSREAYVSPTRGAQGNALKTILAMPFVLDGEHGRIDISSLGIRHEIAIRVDRIRQAPVLSRDQVPDKKTKTGTSLVVHWPNSACSNLVGAKERFLQFAEDYTVLNPHLTLSTNWFGELQQFEPTASNWSKWRPSDPTSPHWYKTEHLERLIAAYVAHDMDTGRARKVREFVAEFRGLSGSAKGSSVLEATGLARANLSSLANGNGLDTKAISKLLNAMQQHCKPVKPQDLGIIGRDHLATRLKSIGCDMETFQYRKVHDVTDQLPWVVETAFAGCPGAGDRRLVTGVNWSPGIINPFRELGSMGESLDSILEEQRAGSDEPIVFVLHSACPRVEYTDRGKSAVVVEE